MKLLFFFNPLKESPSRLKYAIRLVNNVLVQTSKAHLLFLKPLMMIFFSFTCMIECVVNGKMRYIITYSIALHA